MCERVFDNRTKEYSVAKFQVYQDTARNWRWRVTAKNGRKVAASGESFASRSNAVRAAETVRHLIAGASLPASSPVDMNSLIRAAAPRS